MIKVEYKVSKTEQIEWFNINGHARSTNPGENDLVCAGASAIVFGILNSIDDKFVDIKIEDNNISIKLIKDDKETNVVLSVLLNSLRTIENTYSQFIKIKEIK